MGHTTCGLLNSPFIPGPRLAPVLPPKINDDQQQRENVDSGLRALGRHTEKEALVKDSFRTGLSYATVAKSGSVKVIPTLSSSSTAMRHGGLAPCPESFLGNSPPCRIRSKHLIVGIKTQHKQTNTTIAKFMYTLFFLIFF